MDERIRGRPPSIRDVAERAGVSYQTVSRVLNHQPRIRPSTVERVHAAIDELGYRPNRAARALVTSRTHTIGVLLSARALHGPFSSFLAIVDAARARGYTVTAAPNASDDPADIVSALESLLAHGVEGIVAIAPQDRAREAIHRSGSGVPVITLQGGPEEVDGFGIDQREGARLATRHLLELGHTRIAHLPGPVGWAEAEERQRGYVEEMTAHGLQPRFAAAADWTADGGYAVGADLFAAGGVTAVFVANDDMAVGLLAAARAASIRVPENLSVVGFDDVPTARFLEPALTTVQQDFAALGRRAIAGLLDEIEGAPPGTPHPRLVPGLVVRCITGPYHDPAALRRDG